MKTRLLSLALLLLLAPAAAAGQTLYVASPPAQGEAPTYTGWTSFSFDNNDDGKARLALPFAFSFFGQSYASVDLSTNGLILFNNTYCGSTNRCYTNASLPAATQPNNFVAFWWDDMKVDGQNGQWTSSGIAPDRVFAIRLTTFRSYSSPGALRTVQVDLQERSGAIAIYYGAIATGVTNETASVGLEDGAGASGLNALSCSPSCTASDWPANRYVVIAPAVEPDLLVLEVSGSALVPIDLGGEPGFSVDVTLNLKNQGQNPATGFGFDLYLSSDATIDPATDLLLRSHAGPETLAGRSEASFTETAVRFVRPAGTSFYLGAVVDPANAVSESTEVNNRGASAPYVTGAELTGSVSGPANAGPGDTIELRVGLQNRGIDPAGAFAYDVWLSSDRTLDPAIDTRLPGFPMRVASIGGGETIEAVVQATMPRLSNGAYYYLLQVDAPTSALPAGEIAEADETNNLVASAATVAFSAADLVLRDLRLLSPVDPFPELPAASFGETVRVSFEVQNAGGALASGFDLALYLSDNPVITVYDQVLMAPGLTGLTLIGGETRSFAFDLALPSEDAAGAALPNGGYYLGLVADLHDAVTESSEWNNIVASASISLGHPSTPCADASECSGLPCVDGFCCDTACGSGDPADCQACSALAGAAIDGRCGPVASGVICRAPTGACDALESCDGTSLACPADRLAAPGTPCDDGEVCTYRDQCDGAGGCAGTNACFADAGIPADAGEQPDAGLEQDAGADASEPDAGEAPDAQQPADAGPDRPDAAVAADAAAPDGSSGVQTEQVGGCGCTTGAAGLDFGGLLFALAALSRRRR